MPPIKERQQGHPGNRQRSRWAAAAILEHAIETGIGRESNETQLCDLLCNLRHWADRHCRIPFDQVLARATDLYREEKEHDDDE